MFLVEMTDVGRNNASVSAEMSEITLGSLTKMARPHLVSSEIWFDIKDDDTGVVKAGFRSVGKIKITEIEQK